MAKDELKTALAALFPLITERFKSAHSYAAAANTCAEAGDLNAAFHILLDAEHPAFDAKRLLDVTGVLKHELDK